MRRGPALATPTTVIGRRPLARGLDPRVRSADPFRDGATRAALTAAIANPSDVMRGRPSARGHTSLWIAAR
jgi:hypothetical protein